MWTYQTTHDDGRVVTWTQEVLPQDDGRFVLHTEIEGTSANLYYQCDATERVTALGGDTLSAEGSTEHSMSPPMEQWPGGGAVPAEVMSWTSESGQSGTWSYGGQSGSFGASVSATWSITGAGLTYDLGGETLTGCHSYTRAATVSSSTSDSQTTEQGIYCGSLYGLVWTDVVTRTTASGYTDQASSVTALLGVSFP